jgi:Ca2+-transporting ATPase
MISVQQSADEVKWLSQAEAHARFVQEGPNELQSSKPRSIAQIVLEVVREPMFLLLIACGVLYLAMGDAHDAFPLLGFVFVVMGITVVQQRRTERALDALKSLSSPRALVWRDGKVQRIPGREVVRDDLLVVSEGDRIAADAVLLSGTSVAVDESLLTGESVPVRKAPGQGGATQIGPPGGDETPYLFSGTLVVQGKGNARVVATGMRTSIGGISRALAEVREELTHVQVDTRRAVRVLAISGIVLSIVIAVVYTIDRGDWLNGVLAGLTTTMALVPEELPVILTVFLGLGAWRIAQKRVLTRRVPAIEMLGAATVLCADKTGTLTENSMSVEALWIEGSGNALPIARADSLPEQHHAVLEFAALAGSRDPFDPMEQAIIASSHRLLAETEHLHPDWRLVTEYPLSGKLKTMSRVWMGPRSGGYIAACKGAPEDVVTLCHLEPSASRHVLDAAEAMASRGLRVLGVARAMHPTTELPEDQREFAFDFVGLVGLADPLRNGVPAAVAEARSAGVRVVMITGDYPPTALSIARQAGLDTSAGFLTGADIDGFDEARLRERVASINVFCRVVPEQKLRLVNALKADAETVAMTGDGVNDAPALKAAHIGIAMGRRGTDVAREAADLVLLDDDFMSIVAAIRTGRRIFENLQKAVIFIVAVHVPIVGMSLLPVLFGWPLMLMPIHVMFLQLIIDPVCSVVFEAEPAGDDAMRRPPRAAHASIFGRQLIGIGLLQGFALLAAVLAVDFVGGARGLDADRTRALAFATLALGGVGLVFANRSLGYDLRRLLLARNAALWPIAAATIVILGVVLAFEPLRDVFHFGAVPANALVLPLLALAAATISFWFVKRIVGSDPTPGKA